MVKGLLGCGPMGSCFSSFLRGQSNLAGGTFLHLFLVSNAFLSLVLLFVCITVQQWRGKGTTSTVS